MKDQHLLKQILQKEGLRYTHQRQAIWDEMKTTDEHRDAEEIYLALLNDGLRVSRATVYRTIDVLVHNGLVRKLDLGEGRSRYEKKMDVDHHDHLICTECGKIEEFVNDQIEALQDEVAEDKGFKLVRHIHQLYGLCPECR